MTIDDRKRPYVIIDPRAVTAPALAASRPTARSASLLPMAIRFTSLPSGANRSRGNSSPTSHEPKLRSCARSCAGIRSRRGRSSLATARGLGDAAAGGRQPGPYGTDRRQRCAGRALVRPRRRKSDALQRRCSRRHLDPMFLSDIAAASSTAPIWCKNLRCSTL